MATSRLGALGADAAALLGSVAAVIVSSVPVILGSGVGVSSLGASCFGASCFGASCLGVSSFGASSFGAAGIVVMTASGAGEIVFALSSMAVVVDTDIGVSGALGAAWGALGPCKFDSKSPRAG